MSLRFIFGILCLGIASASLIDMLKSIHQSPSFKQLPHRSQIILIEMLAETEAGELKSYIDLVGFENVINIIDRKYRSLSVFNFSLMCLWLTLTNRK